MGTASLFKGNAKRYSEFAIEEYGDFPFFSEATWTSDQALNNLQNLNHISSIVYGHTNEHGAQLAATITIVPENMLSLPEASPREAGQSTKEVGGKRRKTKK